jgi:hypothetical protein
MKSNQDRELDKDRREFGNKMRTTTPNKNQYVTRIAETTRE